MILLTLVSGLLVAIVGGWLLVEAIRQGRRRIWLALAIPFLLAWPLGLYAYGNGLLGYATASALTGDFNLVSSFANEQEKAIYALVIPKGTTRPRLYIITDNYEKNRKTFGSAQARADKGMPMAGHKPGVGEGDEGAFVFYALPPQGVPLKF